MTTEDKIAVSVEIEHAECPKCRQQTVVRDDGKLARHRLPAPRPLQWVDGFLVLGPWCHDVTDVMITDRRGGATQ